ncbi:MAG: 30S ribosomal protein S1 [Nitrospiraceae bacterium]|nr:30S ribosomal protein S1 [Nitrospiraceae bacterium]
MEQPIATPVEEALANDEPSLDEMYEESFRPFTERSVVEGEVINIGKDHVLVDIGYKSEGMVSVRELTEQELEDLKVGDRMLVFIEQKENHEGNLILSKEKADKMKVWEELEKWYHDEVVIESRIVSRIKGGMIVDIGVKAFLPGSQVNLHPVRDLDALIGKTFPMKIIKFNHQRGSIVVSRRVVLEEARAIKRKDTLASLEEGQFVDGTVKNITAYGAFIDLGGIDGLLHITDMSWGRVTHPAEICVVGDKINVRVLKYDRENSRVSLGLKQRSEDPWIHMNEKYPVGIRHTGKVVSLADYGAFVELEPGIEGLVHVSEMSWTQEIRHPSKILSVGSQIEVTVLHVDQDGRKISLGTKQTEPNPWDLIERKYAVGATIPGKVKSLTDFGAFIGLEEGIDGLIHISDMSWTKHIRHPSEIFKKGSQTEAVVLKIDREKERLSLGYKQLTANPWDEFIPSRYHVGEISKGRISKITDFGIFVELEEGVEGLIHVSEADLEGSAKIEDHFTVDTEVEAKLIKVDTVERKIALSIREYRQGIEREQIETFNQTQQVDAENSDDTATETPIEEKTDGENIP